jgi:hypothetical protein
MNSFTWTEELEKEIAEEEKSLQDDCLLVKSRDQLILEYQSKLYSLIHLSIKRLSDTLGLECALREISHHIGIFLNNFEFEEKVKRVDHRKDTALDCIIGEYPSALKYKMLDAFDKKNYDDVIRIAAEFDIKSRSRPYANTTESCLEDPLNLYNKEKHIGCVGDHINFDKVIDNVVSMKPELLEFGGQTRP